MELFDVLTPDGQKTGLTKERSAVHRDGDWHGSVHIWVFREGKALLQRRAATKDSYPLCLDAASTGHIDAGEDALSAAVREVGEELGLPITPDRLIELFCEKITDVADDFISNEHNTVFLLLGEVDPAALRAQPEEVAELLWLDANELLCALREGRLSTCIRTDRYERVLKEAGRYMPLPTP